MELIPYRTNLAKQIKRIELYAIREKGYHPSRQKHTAGLEGIAVIDAISGNSRISGMAMRFYGAQGHLFNTDPQFIVYASKSFPRGRYYANFNNALVAESVLRRASQLGYGVTLTLRRNGTWTKETTWEMPPGLVLQTNSQRELAATVAGSLSENLETLVDKLRPYPQQVMDKDAPVVPLKFNYLDPSTQRLWHYTMRPR